MSSNQSNTSNTLTPPGETVKQEKIEIALPPNPKSAPRKQLRNNKSD